MEKYKTNNNKDQGVTVNKAYCYASSMWDRALIYIAMTRHGMDKILTIDSGGKNVTDHKNEECKAK